MNQSAPPDSPPVAATAPGTSGSQPGTSGSQQEMHLALDWGMDAVRAILCDSTGRSLVALRSESPAWNQVADWSALRQVARDVLARSPRPVTWARSIVLCAPAQVLAAPAQALGQAVLDSPREAMARALSEDLGIGTARVVSRLEACARAEVLWGSLQNESNWLLLWIDDEMHALACVDGNILRGARGLAGSLGAACLEREGVLAPDGSRGGASAYCSTRALSDRARSYGMAFARPSEVWAQAPHNWTARSLCDEFASRLAQAVGVAAAMLNPSRVVIAGSMGDEVMRGLPDEVALRLSGFCPPNVRDGLQVLAPHFGADAAVMGAVAHAVGPQNSPQMGSQNGR